MLYKHQACHYERREVISFLIVTTSLFLSLTHFAQAQIPAWTQLISNGNSLSVPTTRCGHTAVYDTANNQMIIFGGIDFHTYLNDVWVLSTTNGLGGMPAWTQLFPTPDPTQTTNGFGGLPAVRWLHTAVYDSTNNRMTIFGGQNGETYFNDIWVLSHANGLGGTTLWTQYFPTGSMPSTRQGHTAIYDTTNNRMTIFGGVNWSGAGTTFNDVWVLSNANGLGGTPAWIQLTPVSSPSPRSGHTAVYDAANNRMIIFGGEFQNDVWILSNANGLGGTPAWTQLAPIGGPPSGRSNQTAVYDAVNNRMIIFGGTNNIDTFNDVWVLSNANGIGGTPAWTQLAPVGTPSPRSTHTAVYDNTNNRMTIFGGVNNTGGLLNDVWVLTSADYLTSVPKGIWELLDEER
jgi:hypothetical protein